VKKGNKLYVEGRLTTRSWDDKDSGKKVYRTEIVVNDLVLIGGRGEGEGGGSYSGSRQSSGDKSGGYAQPAPDYGDTGITDDDIPF
jgi:single-strand DNA-binding protein